MITFRCPKCKNEISSTKYARIESPVCRRCRMKLTKLYRPSNEVYRQEELCEKAVQSNKVVTKRLIETFI
jgi:hypothetical protein